MDIFELKDSDGDRLSIKNYPMDEVQQEPFAFLQASMDGVNVTKSRAAEVALRLLERAGWESSIWGGGPGGAMRYLEDHLKREREEAERKAADDAEVERFRLHQLEKQGATDITPWVDETEMHQNLWRSEYLAAKEFFGAPKAEPVTLEFGAAEPDHGTRWTSPLLRSSSIIGDNPEPLQYDERRGGWTWGTCAATMPWGNLGRHMFPLERVV